ncbi:MAG TPA: hypothetical protein VIJ85_01935 [Rhizomicrobium sp.]
MSGTASISAFSRSNADGGRKIVNFGSPSTRITINDTSCAWHKGLEKRLEELIRLRNGWDGYNARPVSLANAVFALGMLERLYSAAVPTPDLVPGYDGDLQAEWHIGEIDIELHVKAPNDVVAWRMTPDSGEDGEEVALTNDFTVVGQWIKAISGAADAVAAAAA